MRLPYKTKKFVVADRCMAAARLMLNRLQFNKDDCAADLHLCLCKKLGFFLNEAHIFCLKISLSEL